MALLLTHTTNCLLWAFAISIFRQAFDLELLPTYTGRFVPVSFGGVDRATR